MNFSCCSEIVSSPMCVFHRSGISNSLVSKLRVTFLKHCFYFPTVMKDMSFPHFQSLRFTSSLLWKTYSRTVFTIIWNRVKRISNYHWFPYMIIFLIVPGHKTSFFYVYLPQKRKVEAKVKYLLCSLFFFTSRVHSGRRRSQFSTTSCPL